MKKLLLLSILFYFLLLNLEFANAQVPSYVPTNGLVGYWPFNGNANDESGNGNNGVVNGATLTSDRFGNAGKAYSFDGYVNISVPHNSSLNLLNDLTLSAWFLSDGPPTFRTNHMIITKRSNSEFNTFPYALCINYQYGIPTDYKKPMFISSSSPSGYQFLQSSQDITNGVWNFISAVVSGTSLKLFINGNLVLDTVIDNTKRVANLSQLLFGSGARTDLPSEQFVGKLDDIAIYNRALSPQEITQLYTGQVIPSYVPTSGLVAYYPFSGNANDASGNGNNGTVNGATLTTDRSATANNAYSFSCNSIHANINTTSITNQMSLSFWYLRTAQGCIGPRVMEFSQGSNLPGDLIIEENYPTGLRIGHVTSTGLANTLGWMQFNSLINQTWSNYVYTNDGTIAKIYQNGILVNQYNSPGLPVLNGDVAFGWMNHPAYDGVNGKLDDIAIYNRALSQSEITSLYTANSCIANITNSDTTICKAATVTLNATAVNSASVTDINGNTYPTVNIGTQTWMQKNLNVSKYRNGDIIPQVTDPTQWANLTTGAWCWYNNDSATYAATYGKMYNWYAVNDPRGLAPDGWHVPSDGEWNKLVKYLDQAADTICNNCSQSTVVGGYIREAGTTHWNSPNTGATNSSNFTALPGGYRCNAGLGCGFVNNGFEGYFWTNTESNSLANNSIYRLVSNGVGGQIYKYNAPRITGFSLRVIQNTPTYLWSTGATTPSITVSPLVTTTYYCTVSDGVNTCRDSVKITVGATAVPSAPLAITGATDVCSYIGADTASVAVNYKCNKVSTASSYLWSVPAGVTLLSGQGDTSVNVRFSASFVSGAITVKSINVCGSSTSARSLSVYKRVAATPTLIQKEFSPSSIVAVTNVTGLVSETYRIKKVLYATSYNWSMNRGTNATITHINPLGVNDTAVIVTLFNCFVRDTLSVKSVTPCSVSTAKTAILYANTAPTTVAGIGTAGGDFAVCVGTTKTFNAVSSTPTATQAPIASYRWTRPANTVITSAAADSSSITVSFNTGFTGGSVTAKGVTACGVVGTTATSAALQYLTPTPLSISSSTSSYNACINSTVTYTAIVGAPTTTQAPASVFRWTRPNNTSITSASADSSSITVRFNTGYVGGTLSVKGQSRCGTQGGSKSQALTHTGCAVGTKMSVPVTTETDIISFEVSLYPNPSAGEFKLLVNLVGGKTPTMTKATVKVIDLQGRLMKSFECNANQVTALGNELKPGVYMVEVRIGNEVKTLRAVRF